MTISRYPGRPETLRLYITDWHACSYLQDQRARTLFADPSISLDGAIYEALLFQGFRRSGAHVYRPACGACERCVPVRIPVDSFTPNRSQRRIRSQTKGISCF